MVEGSASARAAARRRRQRAVLGLGLGVALAAALAWLAATRPGGATVRATGRVGHLVGDTVPISQVTDLRGGTVVLAGKPAVVYFMAAWCSDCAYGEAQLRQVRAQLGDRVTLVSVDVDPLHDTPAAIAAFAQRYGGDWPHVLDAGQRLVVAFGVQSLDTTFVVDARGTIVNVGAPRPGADLVRTLKGLLGR
jgi:cytochrome oxidase Cu insertion factor (SCO1/SenC/PrrC family)